MRKHIAATIMIVAALTFALAPAAVAKDEWEFGIGTGFFGLNIDGDAGISTIQDFPGAPAGTPLLLDASLEFDEVRELLESAFGLGGFAAKGKWVIQYSFAQMELEDDISGATDGGVPVAAGLTFTGSGAEVTAAYRFAVTGKHAWSVLGGARYTKHEYDFDLTIGAGGFGGSEGTYFFNSSANWQFAKSWALGLYGQIMSIEFENDDPGDPDWYLYDAEEFGVGFNVLYTF
jgi:hypothetical protein